MALLWCMTMESTKSSTNKSCKEKIKKILKYIFLPLIGIGILLLKIFSSKKDKEIKQDIKDTKKEVKELKTEVSNAEEQFNDKQRQFNDSIDKTEETVEQILSEKKNRDEASNKFFK